MKHLKTAVAALSATVAALAVSGPAYAGESVNTLYTADGGTRGGSVVFSHDGDKLTVCDRDADGYGVVGRLRKTDGRTVGTVLMTVTKSSKGCTTVAKPSLAEGQMVVTDIYLYNKNTSKAGYTISEDIGYV